ncbi:NDR1/HIN1-like protein 6 [Aristolochia californica]|uniref:NDR1/HIN1-like protein 6 n=1 Tax=Aristolochia californica TaxID=171875 RepID=UPI0035DDCAA0
MADQQKIHPVDVEAQTKPLAPRESFQSEKGDPAAGERYPPSLRRTIPVSHSKPPKKRSCCCRCFCWTLSVFLILLVLIAATGGILYLVFRPKLPKYSVDRLRISDFQVNTDMSVYARFDVTVTARNPNKKIGIYYEKGSNLSVWYTDTNLCSGALPKFYQGHRNTTVLNVALTGQTQIGSTLWTAMQQQQQTGRIPLKFKGDVPVRVKFGRLKLMKVRFVVSCSLVVDNLSANNPIRIRTSSCGFDKLKL